MSFDLRAVMEATWPAVRTQAVGPWLIREGQGGGQRVMQHFGGMQGLTRASIDDLQRIPGISKQLAEAIHDALKER